MSTPKLVNLPEQLAQQRMEEERMHDVLLLLTHLFKHEETTVKLLFDSLYEIAVVNLINKKLQVRFLNPVAKSIARMSKPAFKVIALRWVQKNCPKLITDWLYLQVTFTNVAVQPQEPLPTAIISDSVEDLSLESARKRSDAVTHRAVNNERLSQLHGVPEVELNALSGTEKNSTEEIKRLRSEVRYLAGVSIGAIAALISTIVWINYKPQDEIIRSYTTSPVSNCVQPTKAELERPKLTN